MHTESTLSAKLLPIAPPRTLDVLGVPLALIDYALTLDWIETMISRRNRGYVCVCNVHTVMASREDPELRAALMRSALNVPDGQPLVWAINALGHPLGQRVYGPELMARACARAAASGQRFYLYGGRNQGALVQLALNLRQRYPGCQNRWGLFAAATARSPTRKCGAWPRRSTAPARTWFGSGLACPSRRSGWRGCVRTSMRH